jgi:protein-L-isoaspartate(D-aspartate) O-methyltransferase
VERQLAARGIRDEAVLSALLAMPREQFVPPGPRRRLTYLPARLPIGHGQTLSQPYVVARMLELARIAHDDTVLDVGAGYQTALLAHLCRRVHGIELVPELAEQANVRLPHARAPFVGA